LSSVAFTIANGGITAGMKVYAFLSSSAVDLVRKRAVAQLLTDVTARSVLQSLRRGTDGFN
jgi:predicted peroxiredoxin